MKTQEPSTQMTCPTSISSVRAFHAKASRLLENGSDLQTIQEELSSLRLPESLRRNGLHIFSWKMSPVCYRMTAAGRLLPSSPRLYRELLQTVGRQNGKERQEPPVSQPVAPYADFAGMVEKLPDRQAPSEIRAVLAEVCTERNTAPNRPAFACDLVAGIRGGVAKLPRLGSQQPAMRTAKGIPPFSVSQMRGVANCPIFGCWGCTFSKHQSHSLFEGDCIKKTARK